MSEYIATLITRHARRWAASGDTKQLRELAGVLVELRIRLDDPAGRSWEYRQLVGGAYDKAHLTDEERALLISRVRYHLGEELRRRLPGEQVADAGLLPEGPATRQHNRYRQDRADLAEFRRSRGLAS